MDTNLDRLNAFRLDEIIKWRDIAWAVGQIAVEFFTQQITHEGMSSHFITVTPENVDTLLPPK